MIRMKGQNGFEYLNVKTAGQITKIFVRGTHMNVPIVRKVSIPPRTQEGLTLGPKNIKKRKR